MALDATVGSTTANSYVTVAEADAYFLERANSSKWAVSTEKAALLMTASRMIDWQLAFQGSKVSELQSMQFPRTGVILPSGYEVPATIIPTEVKFAVFELAYSTIGADRVADSPLAGIEQVKAGPLFVKATPAGNDSTKANAIPDHVRQLLLNYLVQSGIGVYRLIRA